MGANTIIEEEQMTILDAKLRETLRAKMCCVKKKYCKLNKEHRCDALVIAGVRFCSFEEEKEDGHTD